MSNEDIIQRINTQEGEGERAISAGAIDVLNMLPTFKGSFLTLTGRVDVLVVSVERIDTGLAAAMSEITAMTVKVRTAQESLGKILEDQTRREHEVSDKLKLSLLQIDSELEKVKVQAATIGSM